ncbi:uncharacterized protein CBL_08763 [Carabus blaptoides fortunei]
MVEEFKMWRFVLTFAMIGEGLCGIFDLTEFDDPFRMFYNPNNVLTRQHHGRCTGTLNGDRMDGICLTRPECHFNKGYVATSGDCTLGICCVYTSSCGQNQISNKRITYFNRTGTTGSSCTYTVNVENQNICQMRIDFEEMNLALPQQPTVPIGITPEPAYSCTNEYFQVISPSINYIPIICGNNIGQHMYVPINTTIGVSQMTMRIGVDTTQGTNRNWRIKVTQIECPGPFKHQKPLRVNEDSKIRAPDGCLQYYYTPTGEVRSFGYDNSTGTATNSLYPGNMDYAICFKRNMDTCGLEFTSNKFILGTGTDCTMTDYVYVPGSPRSEQSASPGTATSDKYCGGEGDVTVGSTITSTTPGPLYIRFKTDNILGDESGLIPITPPIEQGFSWSYKEKTGNTCV